MTGQPDLAFPASGARHASLALFLALYLMLLAFFITLISHSSFEAEKSARTIDSLNARFQASGGTLLGRFTGDAGVVVAEARSFFEAVGTVFETAIPLARVAEPVPGRVLEVTLPAEAIFTPGLAEVRPARRDLLDRVAAAMGGAPPGYRYGMEIVIGSDYPVGDPLPLTETLATARAGALARAAVARGVPAAALAAGVEPGAEGIVRLTFRVSDAAEAAVVLGPAIAPPAPPEDAGAAGGAGAAGPADDTGAAVPADGRGAAGPADDRGAAVPADDTGAAGPADDAGAAVPADDRGAAVPADDRGAAVPADGAGAETDQ